MNTPVFARSFLSRGGSTRQEAFDIAVRQALQAPPQRQAQGIANLERLMIHPRLISQCHLLDEHHPWRQQALLVSDAMEAVANGMYHPEALDGLMALTAESPFYAWKHGILALHFFYEDLEEAVRNHLAQISLESPVQSLKGLILALLEGKPSQQPVAPNLLDFQRRVLETDPLYLEYLQQLTDALETTMEDLFWSALQGCLEKLTEVYPDQAQALALWAWNQLANHPFDEEPLFQLTEALWGRAEAFRLAALGCLAWDAESALLFWMRYLIQGVRCDELVGEPLAVARQILDDFFQAVLADQAEQGASANWSELWQPWVQAWNAEVKLRGLTALLFNETSTLNAGQRPDALTSRFETAYQRPADGQLDLFAS